MKLYTIKVYRMISATVDVEATSREEAISEAMGYDLTLYSDFSEEPHRLEVEEVVDLFDEEDGE